MNKKKTQKEISTRKKMEKDIKDLESKAQLGVGEKDQLLVKVQKELEDWKSQVGKLQDNQSTFEKTKKTLESTIQELKDTLEEETDAKQKLEKQKKLWLLKTTN